MGSHTYGVLRSTGGAFSYRAFYPSPLPRDLPLQGNTVKQLADAEAALGRLTGVGRLLPNPHLLVRPYVLREAVASARIEGTQTSLPEVYAAAAGGAIDADVEEVLNYVAALERGIERLPELPLSMRLIEELHAILLAGVRGRDKLPGETRRSQNWIGPSDATLATAAFVPPPPEALGDALSDLERFIHHTGLMPVLVQCALVHYQFETIHPFLDGNGRLGRLLIVLFLIERERLRTPLLYISPYFEQHRDDYYHHLQMVRDRGEIEAWVRFFLRGVEVQALDAVERAERLTDLRERYRRDVGSKTRSQAPLVVDLAFEAPVLSAPMVQRRLGITRQGARSLLMQLETFGVLQRYASGPRSLTRWIAREIFDAIDA